MFTGIIEAVGEIVALEPKSGDLRLRVKTNDLDLSDVALGDSIATNGVCLTVVELPGDGYWAVDLTQGGRLVSATLDGPFYWVPQIAWEQWVDEAGGGGCLGLPIGFPYLTSDGFVLEYEGGRMTWLGTGGLDMVLDDRCQ